MICRLSVRGVEPCMIPDMQQKPEQHDLTEKNGDTEYEKTRSSYLWVRHEKSFSKFPGSGTIIPALVCLLVSLVWLITSSRKTKSIPQNQATPKIIRQVCLTWKYQGVPQEAAVLTRGDAKPQKGRQSCRRRPTIGRQDSNAIKGLKIAGAIIWVGTTGVNN